MDDFRVDGSNRCITCGAAHGDEHDVAIHVQRGVGRMLRRSDPIEAKFNPKMVAEPGTGGGPCGPLARTVRIAELAEVYIRSIVIGSEASTAQREQNHVALFNAVHAEPCDHERCRALRAIAAMPCAGCGEPIGYDEPYVVDPTTSERAMHEECVNAPREAFRGVA